VRKKNRIAAAVSRNNLLVSPSHCLEPGKTLYLLPWYSGRTQQGQSVMVLSVNAARAKKKPPPKLPPCKDHRHHNCCCCWPALLAGSMLQALTQQRLRILNRRFQLPDCVSTPRLPQTLRSGGQKRCRNQENQEDADYRCRFGADDRCHCMNRSSLSDSLWQRMLARRLLFKVCDI